MVRKWLAAHRSIAISSLSGTVITALVVTVAIVSSGYTAQHVALSDGSVWVANSRQQAIGRANPDVLELNSVVSSTGSDLDVLQSGETVMLFDRTESKIDIVDPATSKISESVPLPPNQPAVYLAGDNVVILEQGTGEVWIVPKSGLATFDAESDSTLSFGTGAVLSVDPDGILYAYSPSTKLIYRVNAASADSVESSQPVNIASRSTTQLSISSVAGHWAVLDADANKLYLDGRTVDLAGIMGAGTGAVLQLASTAGDRVLVGYSAGLISVPLSGATAVSLVAGESGTAAPPLALAGCEYGAWTNGKSWRRCDSEAGEGTSQTLKQMVGNARLSFMTNGDRAVLNDRRSGAVWAVQHTGQLIDNWDALIVADNTPPQDQQNSQDIPPQTEKVQEPPIAIDDAFGARPGRSTVLPVLLNDYDPNGDVLVISDTDPLDEAIGRIDLINQRQQIQLTLTAAASGHVKFSYTITDGRGGSATAKVDVTVKTPNENSPPEQVRNTKATVQAGGRVTTQVLSDWVDPDGDPFYLTAASVAAPDSVSSQPGGSVVYSDSGSGGDLKLVTLVVSDGKAESSGSVTVTVKPAGQVPIVTDPFVVLVYAGQDVTISPLDHVRGGSGTLRLNSVPAKADVTITPSYESGTFRFESDQIRSYYVEYVVTDGSLSVNGLVRVDVASPPDANTKPITVPKTVFVKTLSNERIDVAGTDVDPAGGVLLVTGIMNLPANSGVRAEVLEQRLVRVSLEQPLDNGPVSFNYRISNGLAEAQGVITVIEIPTPTRVQPPIANDDSATVRVGEAIDIPVLDNDEHPDGLDLTLQPKLAQDLPPDSGLLFAAGNVLRYLAPNKSGNFTAAYTVTGPDGQAATALVHIAVREADVATNNAPVPETVTARVIAGETVRITIPLAGIDPDGDSVQLLGQTSNPEKGSVLDLESNTIVYQAGQYSAGTDTFTYGVIDSLGARATGTIRVGISPRLEGARNPVAIVDEVTVRPGVTVSVQVLANDSDPDGSPLKVTSVIPNDPVTTAKIVGEVVNVTPPRVSGTYGVIYTIENDTGGTSQNFIRVTVDPKAPLSRPVATDSVLTLSDILNRPKVTVDVLGHVFYADGADRSVGLSVYNGYGGVARVTPDKRIEVTIGAKRQIIPFKVTNPQDPSIFTYAFIRVPGTDDALPQLDRRAAPLKVNSEQQLVIDLNQYVIAVGGKQVRLTDSSTVAATHSNGAALVRDDHTLVFTSADKYFGPASISFEVTDGTTASDPGGRTAILVLPITVEPRDNQPPSFNGAVISFEPGEQKVIDLLKLTTYPYPNDLSELVYSELAPLPVGFSYTLSGSLLTLKADDSAVKGTQTSMTLGVRDALSDGKAGRIDLSVVQSTKPLVRPGDDSVVVKRGTTATVDVLANDQATNPFPEKLRVIDIRGLSGGTIPAGVTIVPSADKSSLTVTIDQSAAPGDVTLQYEVADATNDPDRYVWGTVTVSVQDRPDPVANIAPTGFADHQITMRWNAGAFNNSPIVGYKLTATSGTTVVYSAVCTGTTCAITTAGNGPSNAVSVTVIATNAIGDSDPVTLVDPVWSDIIPPAPTVLSSTAIDHGLQIQWNSVTTPVGGSPVDTYHVQVGGYTGDFGTSICSGGTCSIDTTAQGWTLDNGVAVNYTVSPRNAAYTALSVWNSSDPRTDVPAGPPIAVASPLATTTSDTAVQVDWPGVFSENGRPITNYTAAAYTGTAPTCSANGVVNANGATIAAAGTGTSAQLNGLSADGTYTLVVFAYNGQGCSASPAVVAHTKPGVITALSFALVPNGAAYDVAITGGSMGGTALTSDYTFYYVLSGGSTVGGERGPVGLGAPLTADGSEYGQSISVQVRACRTYDSGALCQDSLSSIIDTTRVAVDPNATGVHFVSDGNLLNASGTFSWTGMPTGNYDAVEVACGSQPGAGTFVPANTVTSCHADVGLFQQPYLTVRVTANGSPYTTSYNGNDYQ
ncbi:MAG: Ig-like domain-containing protein [Rhodoglobus sp.]